MTLDIRFQPGPEDARRDDDDEQSQSSSETDDEDQTWDDWVSDSGIQPCKSLFDDEIFKTVEQAVGHDKEKYGFDLSAFSTKLGAYLGYIWSVYRSETVYRIGHT